MYKKLIHRCNYNVILVIYILLSVFSRMTVLYVSSVIRWRRRRRRWKSSSVLWPDRLPVHLNNILVVLFLKGCKTHVPVGTTTFLMPYIARRRHHAGTIFFTAENLYIKKKNFKINLCTYYEDSNLWFGITLVLMMLRLIRLNFRFRDQYMNGFQKLLLNATHVIMKSTAGGIYMYIWITIKRVKLLAILYLSYKR